MNNKLNESVGQDYPDGQSDGEIAGYKTIETVETKIGADGMEETHITHEIKKASQWTFCGWDKKKYERINWNE